MNAIAPSKPAARRFNGFTPAQIKKFASASTLRAEWNQLLVASEALRNLNPSRDGASLKYFQVYEDNIRTLLAALDAPESSGSTFATKLACVGNPDMGQHHGEGVAAPTVYVEADSIATLVKVFNAYIAVYDMGSGNVARAMGDVYREGALVARISYNGRVWTPEEANRKEIDPATGNLKG